MERVKYLFVVLISFVNIFCWQQSSKTLLKISVEDVKVESWLNLMPGGPGSFHITGEIKMKNQGEQEVDSLSLSKISILQNDKQIYSFTPIFKSKIESKSNELMVGEEKDFLFYTQTGLSINNELNTDLPIKIVLFFNYGSSVLPYEIKDLKVEKIY